MLLYASFHFAISTMMPNVTQNPVPVLTDGKNRFYNLVSGDWFGNSPTSSFKKCGIEAKGAAVSRYEDLEIKILKTRPCLSLKVEETGVKWYTNDYEINVKDAAMQIDIPNMGMYDSHDGLFYPLKVACIQNKSPTGLMFLDAFRARFTGAGNITVVDDVKPSRTPRAPRVARPKRGDIPEASMMDGQGSKDPSNEGPRTTHTSEESEHESDEDDGNDDFVHCLKKSQLRVLKVITKKFMRTKETADFENLIKFYNATK